MKPKTILITGATGFIASYFIRALQAADIQVKGIDIYDSSPLSEPPLNISQVDVRDTTALSKCMAGCDAVLHLAAAHHDYGISKETFDSVNVFGAENMVAAMKDNNINNLCFFSSVAVYGAASPPKDENTIPKPQSPYGESKLAAENVFRDWGNSDRNAKVLVVRPTVTFGPRNFANMFSLIRQIDIGRYLNVGSGHNRKSVCYVENIVAATIFHWLTRPTSDRHTVFNYVDKPDLTSREIATIIAERLGKSLPRLNIPYSLARTLVSPLDMASRLTGRNFPVSGERIKKLAKDETTFDANAVYKSGFVPPYSIKDGIEKMVDWYVTEGKEIFDRGIVVPHIPKQEF